MPDRVGSDQTCFIKLCLESLLNTKTPPSPSETSSSGDKPASAPKRGRKPAARARKTAEKIDESEIPVMADVAIQALAPSASKATTRRKKVETKEEETPKKRTGRKKAEAAATEEANLAAEPKKRGRPRKNPLPDDAENSGTTKSAPRTGRKPAAKASAKTEKTEKLEEKPAGKTGRKPSKRAAAPEAVVERTENEVVRDISENIPETQTLKDEIHHTALEDPGEVLAETPDIRFADLGLSEPVLRAIDEMGYTQPTPIQAGTIPDILNGRDVLGVAQTGTGKTASFTLPMLEKLSNSRARARMPRSLILEPTRELALQVAENFELYGKYLSLTHALLIGGNSMAEQRDLLNRGVDVLIATPGRLLDLFERGGLLLTQTDLLVIDEADRMLDMGFIPDIERIVQLLPQRRQTLFFSATMAPPIRHLADSFLRNPKEISVARQSSVASTISEWVFLLAKEDKQRALLTLLRTEENLQNAIIFCNRKRDVDLLHAYLARNHLAVGHLHGDLAQNTRFDTLERFRSGDLKVLVCSDVAARGIDISGLSHVFNFDLPFNAEDYVHRIGRTGRAGKEGRAFSFATADERPLLEAIESLTGKQIEQAIIEGFLTPAWTENGTKKSRSRSGRRKKTGPSNNEAKASVTDKVEQSEEAYPAPSQRQKNAGQKHESKTQKQRAYGQHLPLDKNGFLPAISEKDTLQHGFGENVPGFMKISFPPQPRSFPVA